MLKYTTTNVGATPCACPEPKILRNSSLTVPKKRLSCEDQFRFSLNSHKLWIWSLKSVFRCYSHKLWIWSLKSVFRCSFTNVNSAPQTNFA